MVAVKALLMAGNRLHGNLDSMFAAANSVDVFQDIVTIDLGTNQFTGSLPATLFNSDTLQEFYANSNCFSSSIPSALCNANTLKALDLSGMMAGDSCIVKYGGIFNFYLAATVPGDIPSCLFASTSLEVLSLNGNGIRSVLGDIPSASDSQLQNVSLSNNRIHGSIPLSIQQYRDFRILDLAYNQIDGTIEHATWFASEDGGSGQNSTDLMLKSNRLSGEIPDSFQDAAKIDILTGNLFACDAGRAELPVHDPAKANYICGSALADGSMVGFAATVGVRIAAACCILFLFNKNSPTWRVFTEARTLLFLNLDSIASNYEVNQLQFILRRYRYYLFMLLCLIWMVFTPIYLGMKSTADYSTHTHQYGWIVSLGFLKKHVPGMAIFGVWMCLLPALVVMDIKLSRQYRDQDAFLADSVAQSSDSPDVALWKGRYLVVAIIINIAIVVFVNGGYVYVVLTQTAHVQFGTVVLTSLFKTVWTVGVMNHVLRILSCSSKFLVPVTVLNNIVIPVIGTILIDIDCFQTLFVPPLAIENKLVVRDYLCTAGVSNNGTVECLDTPLVVSTSFVPPFVYSGQCSESLLTNYIPVYVVMFGIVNVLQLMGQLGVLCYFTGVGEKGDGTSDSSKKLDLLHMCKRNIRWLQIASFGIMCSHLLPIEPGDDLKQFHEYNGAPMYNLRQLGVKWVFGMLLILTFGIAYPPLSVVIFADMIMLSVVLQLCISRHLQQLADQPDLMKDWNIAFKIEMGQLMTILFNPKPVMSTLSAVFVALFLYDMISDSDKQPKLAIIYCMVLICWGILVSVLYSYYEESLRQNALAMRPKSNLRRYSLDAVELAGRPISERIRSLNSVNTKENDRESQKFSAQSEVKNPMSTD